MDNLNVSEMERALSEFKRQEYLKKLRPSEYLREQADAFRKGIGNRQKARQVLGSIVTPPAIEYVSLDTSFLIWPFRFGGDPQFSLFESHTQPLNNFANIVVNSEFDSDFFVVDQVAFYFMWQNDTGSDAVLNVEAFLNLSGLCVVRAKPGYLWTPFWNVSNIGKCRMVVSANLALLEWWNQPPTQPLQQVGQVERAKDLSVSGGFIIVTVGDNFEFEVVQSSHHLHYDQFFVPRDGIAVFEVSLQLSYSGYKGLVSAFFDTSDRRITCPSVELEIVTGSTSPVIHG